MNAYTLETIIMFFRALPFALLLTIPVMFLYLYILHPEKSNGTLRGAFRDWAAAFRTSPHFRRTCLLVLYTAIVLFVTILGRSYYATPLDNIMGDWWFQENAETGMTEYRWLLNICMLLPFSFLLLWTYGQKLLKKPSIDSAIWLATKSACLFSLVIEISQLVLHVGTFQISDLCYNTFGGALGGLLSWPLLQKEIRNNET